MHVKEKHFEKVGEDFEQVLYKCRMELPLALMQLICSSDEDFISKHYPKAI